MKKIYALVAIFVFLIMLFPASTATISMKQHFKDPNSITTERQILPHPDDPIPDDPGEETDYYFEDIPGVYIEYVELDEPEDGEELPSNPGLKSSFLSIRGLYYLENLKEWKKELGCKIYAYCLMTNHIHLIHRLQRESGECSIIDEKGVRATNKICE